MNKLQTFILTYFELSSFIILWSTFNKGKDNSWFKNLIVILLTSFVVLLTNYSSIKFISITNYIFLVIIIKFLYDKDTYTLVSQICISSVIFLVLELILTFLIEILNKTNNTIYTFKNGIIVNILIMFFCLIIYIFLPIKNFYKKYEVYTNIFSFLLFNSIVYIICIKLLWDYDMKLILNHIVIFTVIFISSNLVNFIFLKKVMKLEEERKKIELNVTYTPVFENMVDEIRRKQHEFKNHLNTIYGLCYITDNKLLKKEIMEYIQSISCSLESVDIMLHISNKMLAAIIYSKLCEARNKKIKFSYYIKDDLNNFNIKDYDLVEILCNLLNNAFEALESLDICNRIVYMKLEPYNNKHLIEIGNKGITIKPQNISLIFKKRFSTKNTDTNRRGYGLYNVQKILENYDGKIQVYFEQGYTIFKVLL